MYPEYTHVSTGALTLAAELTDRSEAQPIQSLRCYSAKWRNANQWRLGLRSAASAKAKASAASEYSPIECGLRVSVAT